MLEMAASGAAVLQLRSVEYARNHRVRIHCRSSFLDDPGTVVVDEAHTLEQPLITAVTHSTAEARLTLVGVPNEPGAAARILCKIPRSVATINSRASRSRAAVINCVVEPTTSACPLPPAKRFL